MYWDRFDICAAYWMFGMLFHEGQFSEAYSYMGRAENVGFRPSPLWSCPADLPSNAKMIYQGLVERTFGRKTTGKA